MVRNEWSGFISNHSEHVLVKWRITDGKKTLILNDYKKGLKKQPFIVHSGKLHIKMLGNPKIKYKGEQASILQI